MYKSLVVLALLAVAFASPIDNSKGYAQSLKDLFESEENDSPVCKEETKKFKECFESMSEELPETTEMSTIPSFPTREEVFKMTKDAREGLICVGEVTCNKLLLSKYMMETIVYAAEHVYGEGFECFDEDNLRTAIIGCLLSEAKKDQAPSFSMDSIASKIRPISKCVAQAQVCGPAAKKEFSKGVMAFAEMTEVALEVAKTVETGDRSYIDSFDKKFNPAEFDQLE